LNKVWPDIPKHLDVRDVRGDLLEPVDCINFGSPCQDLSVAGKRKGLSGERSGLFHEAMRIIKEMRHATNGEFPRLAIWENVPGALTSNRGADFGVILDEMVNAGSVYLEWAVLDAQYFGVPQRRRRVFVCAVFNPADAERCGAPVLSFKEGVRRHSQAGRQAGKDSSKSFEGSTGSGDEQGMMAFENSGFAKWQETDKAMTLRERDYKGPGTIMVEPPIVFHPHRQDGVRLQGETINTLTAFMGTGGLNTPMVAQPLDLNNNMAMTLRSGGDGGVPSSRGENLVIEAIAYDEYNDTLVPGRVHHSLRAGTRQSNGVLQDMVVRRLSPLECERLMGWPDGHTKWTADGTIQADTHRYKQCGNGVVAPVAKWIGKKFGAVLTQA